ncbi:MAG: pyridoxal-phosphate dependent enzyme [Bacteroidetes bacterium]|nr:pyridoxal-phosphate dependent enzyme [Bacteroidota bacterium]
MNQKIPRYEDILIACNKIKDYVHQTPVLQSGSINKLLGCDLFFKCENFQKVGAFKFRGACNAVFSLSEEQAKNGVATHSSGNHAAALALAAKLRGIPSYIVMPENSPEIKKKAVKGYRAEITYCKPTLEARESELEKIVKKTGAAFIHPYDNFQVISGQGTAAKELVEKYPSLDTVIAPVGGGGLLSGTATWVKSYNNEIEVIAAEPEKADDAYRSFKSGILQPSLNPDTIADGLLTSLSEMTFSIIREKVDDIITVSEETIVKAMRIIWERMKIIIEPSSAVALGAVMEKPDRFANKKVGIILSGGNVDLKKLPF